MTDYKERVNALRGLANGTWKNCEYTWFAGEEKVFADAAAAIEALQAENADIREELFISQRKYDEFTTIASMQNAMLAKQLPKRGKWIGVSPTVDTVQCSVCGGQLFSEELETPYCPYCGAKMMEVQE